MVYRFFLTQNYAKVSVHNQKESLAMVKCWSIGRKGLIIQKGFLKKVL